MSFETIKFEIDQGVAKITLNRPEKMNTFNGKMFDELRDIMPKLEGDDVRAVLITGEGRAFGAGADLSDGDGLDVREALSKNYNPLIRFLTSLEKPVISAVNGPAAGASVSLALAADICLAAKSAYFLQAFCHIGLVPDAGGTYFLPRKVGMAKAMGMALLGDKIPAEQAEDMGLIWKVCEDDALMTEATELAARFAKGPTKGLGMIKKAIRAGVTNTMDDQLDLEVDLQEAASNTDDFKEGVLAFAQKRAPNFTGK
ncbi:2-(1,2-epoxy-1,2-dihydrophenyl)acetyl-CoA isomerase [Sneathiella sp. P13V-1]|uniref:enoyl-CoA hydratase-related protein n=1 Tax=Sneathiella sp. P13V-1 TaxID=2697366 RepID=UPI00187B98EE|nr:enoyl-CoA hydratase-related protein [Sneathiella sp. P13V-1]MBE7637381.1 2-(1,2-epoxy-1,2-dihydrophenyl)acetyl-CoA isomerase [Sneathiella sp. P13V-1]